MSNAANIATKGTTVKNINTAVTINKTQIFIGLAAIIAMIAFATSLYGRNPKLGVFLVTGLAMGYVLQRSRFGFAGGVRRLYVTGEGSLTKALLFMFSISLIITAAIHYGAFASGAQAAFRAAEGAKVIPGTQNVYPVNLGLVLGGAMFGLGMMLGGGCASGTLTDAGEGEGRAWIVLLFFILGSFWGAHDMPLWKKTVFFTLGTKVYLPDVFGYMGAIIISLLGFLGIYVFVKWYENKRKRENTLIIPEYSDWEKALPEADNYKFFSKETYHKLFVERWSFFTGAAIFAALFEVVLLTSGKSWGVTSTFAEWGAWIYQGLGMGDVSTWGYFADKMKTINGGFMNDPGTMRDLGLIIGALIAPLLAGRFAFKVKFGIKEIIFYAIAGLFMGYGARLASGCNAGALYSGIANLSLSGWVFLPAMTIGGIIGVDLVKKFKVKM